MRSQLAPAARPGRKWVPASRVLHCRQETASSLPRTAHRRLQRARVPRCSLVHFPPAALQGCAAEAQEHQIVAGLVLVRTGDEVLGLADPDASFGQKQPHATATKVRDAADDVIARLSSVVLSRTRRVHGREHAVTQRQKTAPALPGSHASAHAGSMLTDQQRSARCV